jgi:multiple sugar transport system substrate-binding protein
LLFYNIDILTATGFNSPPKTRDEFLAYSSAVLRRSQQQHPCLATNLSGAALSLSRKDRQALSRDIFSWIWAGGASFWSDGDKPTLDTRTLINDFTFLGTLNRDGLLSPGIFETTGQQRIEQFVQGRVAMMIASSQIIPYLRERMGDDSFGITTIPYSAAGGSYHVGLSAFYAGINVNSAYLDEAWRFLMFLTEKSAFFCAELKAIPGIVSNIVPGDYVTGDFFYSKAWDIFESSRIAEGFSGKPNAEEYENAFWDELQIFFETNRTAPQTVTAIQLRWAAIE